MSSDSHTGQIILLNGAPRSGKSTIARLIQETFDGPWMSLGLDSYAGNITPERYYPGIDLRPGAERPDIEEFIPLFYAALYETIALHSAFGLNVVADLAHHDGYTRPLGILGDCARRLEGIPVLFVGLRCPVEVIMERRRMQPAGRLTEDALAAWDAPVPEPVLKWQEAVHQPGIYDLEIDTSQLSPADCVAAIRRTLEQGPAKPTAFERLVAGE